jgi:DnaK suppressor protein
MDQEKARETLANERARVCREIEGFEEVLSVSLGDSTEENLYDQHMADSATPMLNREIDVSLEENARSVLIQIDRALEKLDEGTYGTCDRCGRPIGEERLEAMPYADLCIDCKRLVERAR